MSDYLPLPKKIIDRKKGQKYMYKEKIVISNGKYLFCEHNRQKHRCKECGGVGICKHNRQKSKCKECGGSQMCQHNRRRTTCKECGGGSICTHGRKRSRCKECGGGSICEHNIQNDRCKLCNPTGYLTNIVRGRVRIALKRYNTRKDKHTMEYIGCSVEDLRNHLENQFENETERCGHPISWENQGEWHIDHIRPCASFDLNLEDERHKCFHYTNLQPMWGPDNISKGATYNEDEDEQEWDDIHGYTNKSVSYTHLRAHET